MAKVTLFKNVFEDEYEQFTVKPGMTLEQIAREYGDDNAYSSEMVECYDASTGETIYLPIEDNEEFGVVVQVNGEIKPLDYEIKEDDLCLMMITPMANGGQSKDDTWNWIGAAVGAGVGILLGGVVGLALWGATATTIAVTAFGGVIGFIAGGIVGADIYKKKNSKADNDSGNQLPDVAGSANQPIIGNTIPLVLGRKEVSPFILGSPRVQYIGRGGKDAYVSVLYAIGYAPLKITDIKFDCLPVARNTRQKDANGNLIGSVVYAGKLSGKANNDGDIEVRWNSNDIKFEILQQNSNTPDIYYGDIYNKAVKQMAVNATPMFIKDSMISDLKEETEDIKEVVQYYNSTYDDGFRTNSIRFTEQYPGKIAVVLDCPEGLYWERSNSDVNGGTERGTMPLWVAVQWRPFSETGNLSESTKGDQINHRSDANYKYDFIKESVQDGWITFDQIVLDSEKTDTGYIPKKVLLPKEFAENVRAADLKDHVANNLVSETPEYKSEDVTSEFVKYGIKSSEKEGDIPVAYMGAYVNYREEHATPDPHSPMVKVGVNYVTFTNGYEKYDFFDYGKTPSGEQIYGTWVIGDTWWDLCPIAKNVFEKLPVNEEGKKYVKVTNWPQKAVSFSAYGNEGWVGSRLFNLQEAEEYLKNKGDDEEDKTNVSQFRLTATADLKTFCSKNGLTPSEFLFSDDNTTKCIEVRVVRISPNYLNETKNPSGSKTIGPKTFHDSIKWTIIETETIDTGLKGADINSMNPQKPVSDRRYRDMCILAMSCKADPVGNIQNQLEKLSVVAQAFAPAWDKEEQKWLPSGIVSKYKYFDEFGNEMTGADAKERYEEKRQAGNLKAERTKGGNNWRELMDEIIFGSKTRTAISGNVTFNTKGDSKSTNILKFLEDTREKPNGEGPYLNNSSASQFLLACYGKHLGIDAMGEDRVHQLAMGEWHDKASDVVDGSKDKSGEPVHMFMSCNAYIYSAQKLEDILSKIAVSGRAGYTLDDNGKLVAVMDAEVPYPEGVLNNQNAIATSIVYDFKPAPSGYLVTFNNEDNFGIAESIPVMLDGEDEKNPKREIEQISFDFVTNITQVYSLGRYMLANKVFGKRALTWKAGIEGASIQYGSVFKVTHDMLMVGQACGRIVDFIEDSQYVYGVILSDSYEFDGKDNHAIEIMQPEQYAESKVIVVDVNSGDGLTYLTTEDGHKSGDVIPCQSVGMTNTVIFAQAIRKDGNFVSGTKTYYFNPKIGNLVNYGIKDKVSDLYRVKRKQPDANFTYTFQLTPYQKDFFNYGAAIPELNRNITVPSRVTDAEISVDNKITLADLNKRTDQVQKDVIEYIDDAISEIGGAEPPDNPILAGEFVEDGIILKPRQPHGGIKNIINEYQYQICHNYKGTAEDEWIDVTADENKYLFDVRNPIEKYPEYDDNLSKWAVRCKAVNGYSLESGWSTACRPKGDNYGTWKIPAGSLKAENINKRVSGRNISLFLDLKYAGTKRLYGDIRFKVSIKKGNASEAESQWWKPNLYADPYESEGNYRDTTASNNYVIVSELFQQIVPLFGQDSGFPDLSAYGYNIVAFNEASECEIDNPIWVIASPTSAKDIAANAINGNKLTKGTVTVEKLHSEVLSAESMATYKMTAATATIGRLNGDMEGKDNYWDLETGDFRVGNEENYLSFSKNEEGKDVFELKTDFSKINSTLAVWPENTDFTDTPAFEVKPDEEDANKGQVTVNAKLNAPYISIFGHSTNSMTSVAMALGIPEEMWGEGDTKIFIIESNQINVANEMDDNF